MLISFKQLLLQRKPQHRQYMSSRSPPRDESSKAGLCIILLGTTHKFMKKVHNFQPADIAARDACMLVFHSRTFASGEFLARPSLFLPSRTPWSLLLRGGRLFPLLRSGTVGLATAKHMIIHSKMHHSMQAIGQALLSRSDEQGLCRGSDSSKTWGMADSQAPVRMVYVPVEEAMVPRRRLAQRKVEAVLSNCIGEQARSRLGGLAARHSSLRDRQEAMPDFCWRA
ncbi:hypothetical protein KCU99_g356, partial [Aureobasidium melanogenum]